MFSADGLRTRTPCQQDYVGLFPGTFKKKRSSREHGTGNHRQNAITGTETFDTTGSEWAGTVTAKGL